MAPVDETIPLPGKRRTIDYLSRHNVSVPNYGFVWEWETSEFKYAMDYVLIAYPFICFAIGAVYVFLIFFIRRLMKDRQAINLRGFALFWNVFLMCLNGFAFARILTYMLHVLAQRGFFVSICTDRDFVYGPVVSMWLCLFPFIKILELGDTIILVLQKRNLHTYFWCHHLLALLGSWYIYPTYPPLALWLTMIVNISHVPVYLYASIHFFKVKLSKTIPLLLTVIEMASVLMGAAISMFPLYYESKGNYCHIPITINIFIAAVFLINFVLCSVFLYKKLILNKKNT